MSSDDKTKTRDLERTRTNILKAGRNEFAKYGLEGARVDRIAKKSGSNKSMIYYIFGGKEDLYLATLESLWEEKSELLDGPLFEGKLTIDDAPELIAGVLDNFMKNQEAVRLVLYDVVSGAKFLRKLRKTRPELFATFKLATGMVDQLGDAGMIRKIDSEKAIFMLSMVIAMLPIIRQHVDIFAEKDSDAYQSLSDIDGWKTFLADVIRRIMLDE